MDFLIWQAALLQGALPVALLVWQGRRPAGDRLRWLWRCALVLTLLGALHLATVWLILPIAVSMVFLALSLVLFLVQLPRARQLPWRATDARTGARFLRAGLLACAWLGLGYIVSGTLPPDRPLPALAFPLDAGNYYVANGGSNILLNPHMKTLGEASRFHDWRGQSYGVDLIGVGPRGLPADTIQPADPTLYRIFGAPVVAPCSGHVAAREDGLPDMPVPVMDKQHLAGNFVVLACEGVHVVLAHLKQGSVQVKEGDSVARGLTLLGLAGNSGNSSQPHLHVHVQTPGEAGAPLSGEPRFFTFDGWFPVRNDRVSVR